MNTENNFRRHQSQVKIQKAFIQLAQSKKLQSISVTEICKQAKLNRSTFYANYADVYELADAIAQDLELNYIDWTKYENSFQNSNLSFLYLFKDIQRNQLLYKVYFNIGGTFSDRLQEFEVQNAPESVRTAMGRYNAAFFRAGITKIIKMWLDNHCAESPEEMYELIKSKRKPRNI